MKQELIDMTFIVVGWLVLSYFYGILISFTLSKIGQKKWQPVAGKKLIHLYMVNSLVILNALLRCY